MDVIYDWNSSQGLRPRIGQPFTLHREGVAYERTPGGVLRQRAAGEYLREFDENGVRTALLELPTTNLITESDNYAAWTKASVGSGVAPVVTTDDVAGPAVGSMADKVVFNAPGGADQSILSRTATISSGAHAGGFWAKAARAEDVGKIIGNRHVGGGSFAMFTLTADWQRFPRTETGASGAYTILLRPSEGTSSGEVHVHLWNSVLFAGSVLSSDVVSGATTATRPVSYASAPFALSPAQIQAAGGASFLLEGVEGGTRSVASTRLLQVGQEGLTSSGRALAVLAGAASGDPFRLGLATGSEVALLSVTGGPALNQRFIHIADIEARDNSGTPEWRIRLRQYLWTAGAWVESGSSAWSTWRDVTALIASGWQTSQTVYINSRDDGNNPGRLGPIAMQVWSGDPNTLTLPMTGYNLAA